MVPAARLRRQVDEQQVKICCLFDASHKFMNLKQPYKRTLNRYCLLFTDHCFRLS